MKNETTPPVTLRADGDIALITIDSPPVNALSHAVRSGLLATLRSAQADTAVQKLPAAATLGTVNPGMPIFDTRGMLGATVTLSLTVPNAGTRTVTINVLGKTTVS